MSVQEATKSYPPGSDVRRIRRVLIAILIAGVLAATVSITVLSRGDGGSLAELRIRDDAVDVRAGAADYRGAIEGQRLAVGDSVRTNGNGQAQVDYFDGSLTRLDSNTIFVIRELAATPGARRISLELDSGRTWSRVKELTSSNERFEIRAGNAVATVRGSVELVDCRQSPTCFYMAIEHGLDVTSSSGETRQLDEGDCVKATRDGGLETCTASELKWLLDGWVDENQFMDGALSAIELKEAPTPLPSAAPVEKADTGRGRRPAPRGAVTTPPPRTVPDFFDDGSSTSTPHPRSTNTPEPPTATLPPEEDSPPPEDEPPAPEEPPVG